MMIQKEYKFYAAHRNEELGDKCSNLHGHRYGVRCFFEVQRNGSFSKLFGDFDHKIQPYLLEQYDHGMLIHKGDPLYATLQDHMQRTGESFKLKELDGPTSVENLAHKMFTEIIEMGFALRKLEIKETDTSVVSYTHADWVSDSELIAKQRESMASQI